MTCKQRPILFRFISLLILTVSASVVISGCASTTKKTTIPTIADPTLTATWTGVIECQDKDRPFKLVIGPFAQYEAAGTVEFQTAKGKQVEKEVIVRRKSLANARYFSFTTVGYKNKPDNGHLYADEGNADNAGRTIRLTRLLNLPGCRRITAQYQPKALPAPPAGELLTQMILPTGNWNGTATCNRQKRYFKLSISEPQNGVQRANISGAGFTLPFGIQPLSRSESGDTRYTILNADKQVGREALGKGTPYAIELVVPVAVQCSSMEFGLYKPIPDVGGAYAQAATDKARPFCESFGFWVDEQTTLRNYTARDIQDMFGSNLGGNIPGSVTYKTLFTGANRNLVYGELPVNREQELLRKIDKQLASCVLYTGRNADDALRVFTKQAFGGNSGRQIWNSVRNSDSDSQEGMLSVFSTLYLQGRDSTVPDTISLPVEWRQAVNDPTSIKRLAKNSTQWANSQDLLAIRDVLSPYRETLRIQRVASDQLEDEAYAALRNIEQPLELALQKYTLKDCSRLGIFLKSDGTAIAEKVVRNGPYCESTTLGTTFRLGLASASGFQCQGNDERLKTCTFNAQMGCSMSSVFGDSRDNRRLSGLICAPVTAVSRRGSATFLRNADQSWTAREVKIN